MKLTLAFVFVVLVACTYGATVEEQWTDFKNLFGRKFTAEEDVTRFALFKKNVELVEAQNAKYARGESTFGAAVNDFSDRTDDEKTHLQGLLKPTPA